MDIVRKILSIGLSYDRKDIVLALLTAAIAASLPMALPMLFGMGIDILLNSGPFADFATIIAVMFVIVVASNLLAVFSSKRGLRIGYGLAQQIALKLYDAVMKMPYLTYPTVSQGVVLSRLTNDLRMIEPLLTEVPLTAVRGWSALIAAGLALVLVDPWFLAAYVVIPISLLLVRYSERQINSAIEESFEQAAYVTSLIENSTNADAIGLIRQARRTEDEIREFDRATIGASEISTKMDFWRFNVGTAYDASFALIAIAMLGLGGVLVAAGTASVGNVVSALLYLGILRLPLSEIVGLRYPLIRAEIGLKRALSVLDSPNTGLATISSASPDRNPFTGASTDEDGTSKPMVEFRNVSFQYPEMSEIAVADLSFVNSANASLGFASGTSLTSLVTSEDQDGTTLGQSQLVLDDVSFSVSRGEAVAIAGVSGAGKSTVVGLICGLFKPTAGHISLNMQDISTLGEEEIWGDVALVSQDIYLRDDTLRNNLAYGLVDVSDERLIHACKIAGLSTMLSNLPNGLDTKVTHRGKRFSVGERQRISIARALLKDAAVLILDEATSNLDSENEANILSSMEDYRKDIAVVVIAHRMAAVEKTDRIVMLDGGKVVETGTHQDLLESGGRYAAMHQVARDGL